MKEQTSMERLGRQLAAKILDDTIVEINKARDEIAGTPSPGGEYWQGHVQNAINALSSLLQSSKKP